MKGMHRLLKDALKSGLSIKSRIAELKQLPSSPCDIADALALSPRVNCNVSSSINESDKENIMDVGSSGSYPSNALSNFAAHEFEIDGVKCASMEGFLQSLKFPYPEMQKEICSYIGIKAKRAGSQRNWKQKQTLYWMGVAYPRKSKEYQQLLDRAYDALYTNQKFKAALRAAKDAVFKHSIGKHKESETVLTVQEFCSRLNKLRNRLHEEEGK